MPTYEYACSACGHEFEREQRITEPPAKKCPGCGKMKARRMVGSGNFILKGGGWYADLYSTPRPKKQDGADGSAKAKDAKPAETKSAESKPSDATSGKDKAPGPKGKTKAASSD